MTSLIKKSGANFGVFQTFPEIAAKPPYPNHKLLVLD
jgi:hypothetical protein